MNNPTSKVKLTKKDIIIIVLFIAVAVVHLICYIVFHGFESVGALIEQTILIMLSFVGLIQIANFCNWVIFVPDFMINYQKENEKKRIESMLRASFREDINFVRDYNEERVSYLISQLGITTNQLDKIRLELIKMRCMPLTSLDDAKSKIEHYIKSDYPFVITQTDMDSSKICYTRVKYYVNFTDPMFIADYSREISSLLAFLIQEKADLNDVDKIVIPHDSNFLLGIEVGKRLGKPIIKMRAKKGKIETAQIWEGNLSLTDKVIIIHDVLVSGSQIVHALNHLPSTCEVLGVYCLMRRKEWQGAEILAKRGIRVEQVVCFDDDDIAVVRGEK